MLYLLVKLANPHDGLTYAIVEYVILNLNL
jgi:hypothetical protein